MYTPNAKVALQPPLLQEIRQYVISLLPGVLKIPRGPVPGAYGRRSEYLLNLRDYRLPVGVQGDHLRALTRGDGDLMVSPGLPLNVLGIIRRAYRAVCVGGALGFPVPGREDRVTCFYKGACALNYYVIHTTYYIQCNLKQKCLRKIVRCDII